TMRTVYLGNMAPDTQVSDILDQVRSGVIEIVRPLPEKNCIFLTFVDATAAAHFCHEFSSRPFNINGVELKIGWGKPSTLPTNIRLALQNGASRNVFLGSLDETVNEDVIREDLKRFGTVEHVRLIREKNIAFVHFLSIANAIKCVTSLPTEGEWQNRRVYYGKDRTSTPSSHHPHLQIHPNQTATLIPALTSVHGDMTIYHPHPTNNGGNGLTGVANRTIYLGNIHPDTTCEEICNVIRGGILSQIRYMVDKHIAFIAFVDPVLALHFYTQASYHGIVIKSRRLKIGWGKPSSLPGAVIQAVQNGGSRNVYLGNMDDSMTEEKLKQDFSEYGDIELVNTLKEKNCAFVNFTSIAAAMRAIEGIRTKEEYKRFRINYGKDRCGNPPRS
ncbi:uncharacterized protein BX664DRAFT_251033, partial [Halteromyces radiatus]|uniref:uncharacterized protein n=1 Tax=Halteromyces radiatus TaxID=101107 RepID=UPI00222044C5